MTPTISPCIILPGTAEEAATFYVSAFPRSKVIKTSYAKVDEPGAKKGEVRMVSIEVMGVHAFVVNAHGDNFSIGQGLSLYVECKDQAEIDSITEKLLAGGSEQQDCGWVVDRFGVSWQLTPHMLNVILDGDDDAKADRVTQALYTMKKIDVAKLEQAANAT